MIRPGHGTRDTERDTVPRGKPSVLQKGNSMIPWGFGMLLGLIRAETLTAARRIIGER